MFISVLIKRAKSQCCALMMISAVAFIVSTGRIAYAQKDREIETIFAGMAGERAKLKSWSYTIQGTDVEHGAFHLSLVSDRNNYRFTRTRKGTAGVETTHVLFNKTNFVQWHVERSLCFIHESTPEYLKLLRIWDPRSAGLRLDVEEANHEQALSGRLKHFLANYKIKRAGALRTVIHTSETEYQENYFIIKVDVERGYTPVHDRTESVLNAKSKFPGKTRLYFEASAKWEQRSEVWVPVEHTESLEGERFKEYRITWNWVNKGPGEKEFTIDALGVPADVKKIYMEKGREVRKTPDLSPTSLPCR